MKSTNILIHFFKYVSLNVLGMIGLSCYILADTFFIAQTLGATGLAALNLAISIYSIIHASGLMIGIGGATQYGIEKAQGQDQKATQIFNATIRICILVSILFFLCGQLYARPLAILLGADDRTIKMTTTYLNVILSFAPCFMLNNTMLAFVRNDKNPRLSMIAMLIGSLGNIILDYLFIVPLSMGMFGAALATGIAPILSLGVLSFHMKQKHCGLHLESPHIKLRQVQSIVSLGLSSFITEVASGVVLIVFNLAILRLTGNIGVAAYGIVANLALVTTSVFTGIAQGIQPLASKAWGTNDTFFLRRLIQYTLLLSVFLAFVIYGSILWFSDSIIFIFNKEQIPALAEISSRGFTLYFIGFFFAGINITMAAFFSAIAHPKSAFVISIARGCAIILPLTAILPLWFSMDGIWMSFTVAEFLTFLITGALLIPYRRSIN